MRQSFSRLVVRCFSLGSLIFFCILYSSATYPAIFRHRCESDGCASQNFGICDTTHFIFFLTKLLKYLRDIIIFIAFIPYNYGVFRIILFTNKYEMTYIHTI
jgi:hypothetical protein